MRIRFTRRASNGIATAVILPALLAGCSGSEVVDTAALARARLEAVADEHAGDTEFVVRWNPAPCEAPGFETRLGKRWHRVFLEPADLRAALLAKPDRPDGPRAVVRGRITGSLKEAGNGSSYLVLEVEAICPESGCPRTEP